MGDIVQFNDVLMAMSQSLMEKQPLPVVDSLVYQDHEIKYKIGGKPPREIFYRNTLTFLTKLPPAVQEKMCTCRYVCFNSASKSTSAAARADVKCHSCAIYDPKGISYFCQECFDAYHPWYRTPHIFSPIARDENIQYTLKIAHRVAEAVRYDMEGKIMMKKLHEEKERLDFVGDDAGIDRDMRIFGRRAVALEAEVARLRQINRKDIWSKNPEVVLPPIKEEPLQIETSPAVESVPLITETGEVVIVNKLPTSSVTFDSQSPYSHNESQFTNLASNASSSLQELSKSHRTESNVSQYTNFTIDSNDLTYSSASSDDGSGTSSYHKYDRLTSFNSLSNMNLGLGSAVDNDDLSVNPSNAESADVTNMLSDTVTVTTAGTDEVIVSARQHYQQQKPQVGNGKQNKAAVRIQSVFKGHMARRIVSVMMLQRIIKVWSPEAGTDFYYDRVTGTSTWLPPKLLLAKDLDDLPYSMEAVQVVKWSCKVHCDRRRAAKITNRTTAATIIQQFGRCIIARNRIIRKADESYRRILDETSDTYYYAHIFSGETSWYKLKLYLTRFPPIMLQSEAEALVNSSRSSFSARGSGGSSKKTHGWGTSSKKRNNPKTNRVI